MRKIINTQHDKKWKQMKSWTLEILETRKKQHRLNVSGKSECIFRHKCVSSTRVMTADSNMIRAVILANNSYCPYKNASLLCWQTEQDRTGLVFPLARRCFDPLALQKWMGDKWISDGSGIVFRIIVVYLFDHHHHHHRLIAPFMMLVCLVDIGM